MISPLAAFVIGLAIGAFVAGMLVTALMQERIDSLEMANRYLLRIRFGPNAPESLRLHGTPQDGSMQGANAPADRPRSSVHGEYRL